MASMGVVPAMTPGGGVRNGVAPPPPLKAPHGHQRRQHGGAHEGSRAMHKRRWAVRWAAPSRRHAGGVGERAAAAASGGG